MWRGGVFLDVFFVSVRRSKCFLILEVESWRSGRGEEGGERLFVAIALLVTCSVAG